MALLGLFCTQKVLGSSARQKQLHVWKIFAEKCLPTITQGVLPMSGHGNSSSSQETEPVPYLLRVSTRGRELLPQLQDFNIISLSFVYMFCGQWLEIVQSFLFCMSSVTWNINGTCLFTEMNVLLLEIIHGLVQVTLVSSIRLSFAYWTWWLDFCKNWCFPVLVAVCSEDSTHFSRDFNDHLLVATTVMRIKMRTADRILLLKWRQNGDRKWRGTWSLVTPTRKCLQRRKARRGRLSLQ